MKLSIISPVYKAYIILDELVRRISSSVESITEDYEIILVEDGFAFNNWKKIEAIENCNPKFN